MIKVAVIDNGIDTAYVPECKIAGRKNWCHNDDTKEVVNYHGSICAKIIEMFCPDVLFYDLVIMQDKASIDDLIEALEWCYSNHIRLINLSLGTINYQDGMKLKAIISKLIQQGCLIVAAYHNSNIKTFPAVFENVFGVCHTQENYLKDGEYTIQIMNGHEIYIACMRYIYLGKGICVKNNGANSYAAPVITGQIASFLSKRLKASCFDVKKYLLRKQNRLYQEEIVISDVLN